MNDVEDAAGSRGGNPKSATKTNAQRQAALRQRRQEQGRAQTVYWLTEDERVRVKALLAGKLDEDAAAIAAERDALAAHLENRREVIQQQQELIKDLRNDTIELSNTLREVRRQLENAEQALKAKPAKTFKVPDLPNRRALIVSTMSQDETWDGKPNEVGITKLKQQADLTKKFATEIRQARSRLVSLVQITSGEKLLEQSKASASWGWKMFKSPLISPAEKALLEEACAVMSHIEHDVERAGSDLDKLHQKREEEEKARRRAASDALDAVLFKHLDRRGEVLFVAAVNGHRGWVGPGWDDLLDGAKGNSRSWKSASESFRGALSEAKDTAITRVADDMKRSGKSAEELANEVAEKYHHPDTGEKFGELADRVTAFLVSEQLAGSK